MSIFSEAEIIHCIIEYINREKTRYAVLIDGEWGCGKTYFLKKTLIPEIEKSELEKSKFNKYKPRRIVYISLYGISTVSDMIKQIWLQTTPLKIPVRNRIKFEVASNITRTVFLGGLSFFNIKLPKIDFTKMIDFSKYILCFDDLERCNMNINTTLGIINSFVEHDEVKTIIVANQKEIGKINLTTNLEEKYLIALQNNIDFQTETSNQKQNIKRNYMQEEEPNRKRNINIDELEKRIRILFGEDVIYKQMKEKLIGLEFQYTPDIKKALLQLIHGVIGDNTLQDIVLNSSDYVVENFCKYNHSNIRTLIFLLEKFDRLGNIVKECKFQSEDEYQTLELIFKYCLAISIKFKTSSYMPEWKDGTEYDQVSLSKELWSFDFILGFRFVDNYIRYSIINKENIINILKRYMDERKKQAENKNDPYDILKTKWYELEDGYVKEQIGLLFENLKNNQYDFSLYTNIIALLLVLKKIGLIEDLTEIVALMKQNIRTHGNNSRIIFDTFGTNVDTENQEEFKEIIKSFIDSSNSSLENNTSDTLNDLITYKSEWSKELYDYVCGDKWDNSDNKFLAHMNISVLFDSIIKSNSAEIIDFRYTLQTVYRASNFNDIYKSDYEKLLLLKDKIDEYIGSNNITGIIHKHNFKWLRNQLISYVEKFSPTE